MLQAIEAIIDEQSHVHWLDDDIRLKKARRALIILMPEEIFSAKSPQNAKEILLKTGFIGCGEASPDLSENYKTELFKKYDNC